MKVTEHIKKAKSALFSIELLPPIKGRGIQEVHEMLAPIIELKPAFVDVTYHREEYIYKKRKGGYLEKVAVRKRPGTVGICSAIQHRHHVDIVPHLICGGFSKQETEDALIEMNYLDIDNVLVLRGDPIKTETVFEPEEGGHHYAIDLLKQVNNINKGIYLEEDIKDATKTNFCIGVGGYPEKHFEAPNMEIDMKHLKKKVNAGADYIVTQMFFDNKKYFDFVNRCRDIGITVPIIPGIKPITKKSQLRELPRTFYIDIPEALYKEIDKCKDDKQAMQIGIEWGIQQSKELIKFGAPCIHYYTVGKGNATLSIASKIF